MSNKTQTVQNDRETESLEEVPQEKTSQTQHTVMVHGQEIVYTATAGTIILKDEDGKAKASMFYVAYARDQGEAEGSVRPITFSFNGGPGSSSVWLHLGLLGPRRVLMDDDGNPPPPPYRLVDNAYSLLDVTDLVFIDPVTTGYSRAVSEEEEKKFHDFDKDIESVGEFIRLYTTRHHRWSSPKFLIGESYGTTRAAGLAGHLQERQGMYLNGIMLISTILNFQSGYFHVGNDLPHILFLPTYSATAWYHRQLDPELQEDLDRTLAEVEEFALSDYALALMRGSALPPQERIRVVAKLARYTGLSEAYIEQADLRIEIHRFAKQLLRSQHRSVGRLDSRFTGIDRDSAGEKFDFDPSYAAIQGPYTACLNDYVRGELGFEIDITYEILTDRVRPWSYGEFENRYVNTAETLRKAMSQNPHLKVFVANGYFDLATPYFATRYTFDHLGLDPSLQDNVIMAHYRAGHMMYIHRPSLKMLKEDLSRFIELSVQAVRTG
jgi:carboxypeptidase C (cathepsin A)